LDSSTAICIKFGRDDGTSSATRQSHGQVCQESCWRSSCASHDRGSSV